MFIQTHILSFIVWFWLRGGSYWGEFGRWRARGQRGRSIGGHRGGWKGTRGWGRGDGRGRGLPAISQVIIELLTFTIATSIEGRRERREEVWLMWMAWGRGGREGEREREREHITNPLKPIGILPYSLLFDQQCHNIVHSVYTQSTTTVHSPFVFQFLQL